MPAAERGARPGGGQICRPKTYDHDLKRLLETFAVILLIFEFPWLQLISMQQKFGPTRHSWRSQVLPDMTEMAGAGPQYACMSLSLSHISILFVCWRNTRSFACAPFRPPTFHARSDAWALHGTPVLRCASCSAASSRRLKAQVILPCLLAINDHQAGDPELVSYDFCVVNV